MSYITYGGQPTRARAVLRWIGQMWSTGEPSCWMLAEIESLEQKHGAQVRRWSLEQWGNHMGWYPGGPGDRLRKALIQCGYEQFDYHERSNV